ncbi:MAG: ABC transporter substrate-binding protein [Deltaproteobacteria bacterium]|nr:ABC transporter substrate-binding protein [Deltaproteobacteria bacterium]
MRRALIFITTIVLLTGGGFLVRGFSQQEPSNPNIAHLDRSPSQPPRPQQYRRIISLAPSITEVLFSLGLGDRVVGVTRYCDYPPEALEKPKIGGYFDINYEAIIIANPDLVVLLKEHDKPRENLKRLGIETLTVDHSSVDGIMESIRLIGKKTGKMEAAEKILLTIGKRIERVKNLTVGLTRPSVMVAVGRNLQTGAAGAVYISGKDGFYDELISMAGGKNAYTEDTLKFPALSAEGVARLNPQVIIEMVPDVTDTQTDEKMMKKWRSIPRLDAVRKGRVYVFNEDYVVIPGPRFVLLLEEMARVIHPEARWE